MQKPDEADDRLWPNEEYAIGQYESGRDEPRRFENPEDLIKDLHKSR